MRIIHRLVTADLHGDFHIGPTEGGSIAVLRFPIVHEPRDSAAANAALAVA